jgi:hypothetical protein
VVAEEEGAGESERVHAAAEGAEDAQ